MTMRAVLAVPIAVVLCCTMSHARDLNQIEPFQPWTGCCRDDGQSAERVPDYKRGAQGDASEIEQRLNRIERELEKFELEEKRLCGQRDPQTNECRE
jgi:hypothetical protein